MRVSATETLGTIGTIGHYPRAGVDRMDSVPNIGNNLLGQSQGGKKLMAGLEQFESNKAESWFAPLIGLCFAIALSWGVGWLQGNETAERRDRPRAYADAAKLDAERTCIGTEPRAVFDCVSEKTERAYQTAHDEQDLTAQQRAASSALASAVLSLFSLLLSAVGVWYVKRTLYATLEAVKDTSEATRAMVRQNDLAENAQRPWIAIEVEVTQLVRTSEGFIAKGSANFRNIGQTVARQFVPKIRGIYSDADFTNALVSQFENWKSSVEVTSEALLPGETRHWPFDFRAKREDIFGRKPNEADRVFLVIAIAAFYEFSGGNGWTFRPYIVRPKTDFGAYSFSIPLEGNELRSWKECKVEPTAGSKTR